ncbi:hypothetical protein FIA58_017355 [Flavobacterium jejuense]|uniref:Uncharacterized protein n=1 Tax=Flavobacterium jejuense TaxID=1544455 RepID=A0ABX0J0H2_9FLAO|nr:hypothetical protein [Flavobacterium jejuense]NHN27450.1 hypothetical protein [Flavobacterium jejuense]
MKNIVKLVAIVFLFQSFQCEEDRGDRNKKGQFEKLQNEKQEILDYIASVPCDETSGCNFIAFGSKPCGGPWEYLVYSNAIDINLLTNLVNNYNSDEAQYNELYNIYSDCTVVDPPENIECIDGICSIIQ